MKTRQIKVFYTALHVNFKHIFKWELVQKTKEHVSINLYDLSNRYIEIFKSSLNEAYGQMSPSRNMIRPLMAGSGMGGGMNRPGPYDRAGRFGMGGGGGGGGGGMGMGGGSMGYGMGRGGRNVKGNSMY